ncbi:MAG: AAA family ATPase [Nitrospirae bacterium]|nr:AAA family ATPase [Nitrospirota bacterium]
MYEEFFGFGESPFGITPDPGFFYLSKEHEEALSNLLYGISSKRGFILLTGEIGTGKTTLSRYILNRLDQNTHSSLILNPVLSTTELLQAINQDFGLECKEKSPKLLIDSLNAFLFDSFSHGKNAVLLIDEAQNLRPEALEMIRLLSNLETEKKKLLQIVLIGQPELRDIIKSPGLTQLNQRIGLRYHLGPLDIEETEGYIKHRIKVAGGNESLFSKGAIKAVYEFSGGIPRLINLICDRALIAAYTSGENIVSHVSVKRAAGDLRESVAKPRQRFKFWVYGLTATVILLGAVYFGFNYFKSWTNLRFLKLKSETAATDFPSARIVQPAFFDSDGIFRVKDSEVASALTLLRCWGINEGSLYGVFDRGLGLQQIASIFGFRTFIVRPDDRRLMAINLPFIIKHKDRGYLVVKRIMGEEAVVLDSAAGKVVYNFEELIKNSNGETIIFWKGLDGGIDSSIRKIQELLRLEGLYKGNVDGIFGAMTINALRSFQDREGLNPTGQLNEETMVMLTRFLYKAPLLSSP